MRYAEFAELWEAEPRTLDPLGEVVARHTGLEGAAAAWFADRLFSHGILNGFRVYSRAKDIEALQELDRAIATIHRLLQDDGPMTSLAQERLYMELIWGENLKRAQETKLESDSSEGRKVLNYIEGQGKSDSSNVTGIVERSSHIRAGIKRTIADIETSRMSKVSAAKLNERGIAIVDAARFIWKLATDCDAPSRGHL